LPLQKYYPFTIKQGFFCNFLHCNITYKFQ
jgi:hypothetical protein